MRATPTITIESSVPIALEIEFGYDGEQFYVANHGVVVAKRGRPDLIRDEDDDKTAFDKWRQWYATEPGWSVIETGRPKRGRTGSLHFRYDPPRLAS
jgi:hypothetical protein